MYLRSTEKPFCLNSVVFCDNDHYDNIIVLLFQISANIMVVLLSIRLGETFKLQHIEGGGGGGAPKQLLFTKFKK